jgi:hypothetical protein
MKAPIAMFMLLAVLSGCSIKYLQYYRTESANTTKTDNNFIYENDSIRITYSFWSNGGVMSFNIFNKLDKPLYIDWKRSSFIIDSNNVYYYDDTVVSQSYNRIYYTTYYDWWLGTYSQPTSASSVTTHQIAATFLPPKTQFKQFLPCIVNKNVAWQGFETQYQVRNDTRRKQTKIFTQTFSKDNSPINFRNFLTLSDDQDLKNAFTIDNAFYVAEMQAMDVRNFREQQSEDKWEYFYKKGTDFYLEK